MDDGSGLAEALLGLDGLMVLAVTEGSDELVVGGQAHMSLRVQMDV